MPPLAGFASIFLHISRGFRLRQAYAVTSRRRRGSTPGLFYGAPHRGSKSRLANACGVSPTTTNLRGPRSFSRSPRYNLQSKQSYCKGLRCKQLHSKRVHAEFDSPLVGRNNIGRGVPSSG